MTRLAVLFAFLLALLSPVEAGARDLLIAGFGGGFQDNARKHLFQAYAAFRGIPVKDDVYNGEIAKIYAMVRSKDVAYDVTMVNAPELVRGCEDGIFEKIDWTIVDKSKFIPGGTHVCGAGAVGWGVTLFWDEARNPNGPKTYAEFFDVAKFPGKRALRSTAKMTLEIALLADGVAKADVYKVLATPEGQKRAFAKLDTIKPNLVWWKAGTQPLQFVGSGEVAYAIGFINRIAAANAQGAKYPILWDTMLYSYDFWAVVRGTPHKDEAMRMVNFITDAKPLLALTHDWPISPSNIEVARDPDVVRRNPGMISGHLAQGLDIDTEFWVLHDEELEQKFSAWMAR